MRNVTDWLPLRRKPGSRAFSTVEILVAIVFLVFGIGAAMDLMSRGAQVRALALRRVQATGVARQIVESWRAAGPQAFAKEIAQPGVTRFPATAQPLSEPRGMAWQAEIQPVEGMDGLVEVRVAVAWNKGASNPLGAAKGHSVSQVVWLEVAR